MLSAYREGLEGRVSVSLDRDESRAVRGAAYANTARLTKVALVGCYFCFAVAELLTLPLGWALATLLVAAVAVGIRLLTRPTLYVTRTVGIVSLERDGIRLESAAGVERYSPWESLTGVTELGQLWVLEAGHSRYIVPGRVLTPNQRTALARLLEDRGVPPSSRTEASWRSCWPHVLYTASVALLSFALLDMVVRVLI